MPIWFPHELRLFAALANENDKQETPFSVLIAMNRNSQPSAQDVAHNVAQLFPKLKPAQDVVEDGTGFGFRLGGSIIVVVRMRGPIPLDPNADEPTVRKPLSPAALASQRACLVIAVRDADPLQAAIAATEVAAAVIECCPHAIAIYWPSARHWIAPHVFVDQASDTCRRMMQVASELISRPDTGLQ